MASSTCHDEGPGEPPLDMDFINHAMTFTPSEQCTVSCGTVCVDPRASRVLIIFNRRLGIWQLPKGRKNIGEDLQHAALRETYEETGVNAALLPLKIRTRSTNPVTTYKSIASSPAASTSTTTGQSTSRASLSTGSASSVSTSSAASSHPTTAEYPIAGSLPSKAAGSKTSVADIDGVFDEGHTTSVARCVNHHSPAGHVNDHISPTPLTVIAAAAVADPKVICDTFNSELVGIVQYPDLQAATPNTIKTVFFFAALADSTLPMGLGAQEDHEDLLAEWVDFQEADRRLRFAPEREAMWKVRRDMKRSGFRC